MIQETKIAMIAVALIFETRDNTNTKIIGSNVVTISKIIYLLSILNVFMTNFTAITKLLYLFSLQFTFNF